MVVSSPLVKLSGPRRTDVGVFASYVLFFAAVFAAFPLQGSFIGNADVIVHTAYFYEHLQWLQNLLGWAEFGNAYYPATGIEPYIEGYWGQAVIFWCFKALGAADIWAIYGLYVSLFTFNAFAVYLLADFYGAGKKAAMFGGIVFAASCFMFSTQEFLNGVAVFPIPLALWWTERYFAGRRKVHFYLAVLALCLQSYFSAYHVFLGGVLVAAVFALRWWRHRDAVTWRMIATALPLAILLIPLILKITGPEMTSQTNPLLQLDDPYGLFSLHLESFRQALPNNLLYKGFHPGNETAVRTTYRANLGFLCFLLFIIGLSVRSPHRWMFLVIFLAALSVAFGPHLQCCGMRIPMPLSLLYHSDFFHALFRMPGRAFIYANLMIALVASFAVWRLGNWKPALNSWAFILLLIAVFSVENQAVPPYVSDHSDVLNIPEGYSALPAADPPLVIADLPSSLFTDSGYTNGISEFTREYRYHYWQTRHHHNSINGSASFFPAPRMENNRLMINIRTGNHLAELIALNDLSYIVFHNDLLLSEAETGIREFLLGSPLLTVLSQDERTIVFAVKQAE